MRSAVKTTCLAALFAALTLAPARAEGPATLGMWGTAGLIDMPSAEVMRDGGFSLSYGHFATATRQTLGFQITPGLTGNFRYLGVRKWSRNFCPPDCGGGNAFPHYYDRNFDISYQILTEDTYRPAFKIGLQDFIGTGLSAAEYLVATKNFGPVKVTAGLGFGRLGSYGSIGEIFGHRPKIDFGQGGMVNFKQWFRGDAAPFGGIEWQITDKLGVKAEYSSDAYAIESDLRSTFEHKSPFNFGIEYQLSRTLRVGAYSMYGSEFGVTANFILDPGQRAKGGMGGPAPLPVSLRPPLRTAPQAYGTDWVNQAGVTNVLLASLRNHLKQTGVVVESLTFTGDTAQVRFRNTKYDASAQAVGRMARALSYVMPASVEVFELVPVVNSMAASRVTIRRSDLERLEFAPDAGNAMLAASTFDSVPLPSTPLGFNAAIYPKFNWALAPYTRFRLFDPVKPLRADIGVRATASVEIRPGLILSGSVTQKIAGDLDKSRLSPSRLPPVRSSGVLYDKTSDSSIEKLTLAWYTNIAPDVYGRVTVGYMERMFGGISAEALWRPQARRWALGAEMNYTAQRDPDGGLGFDYFDYSVATGYVSGYYDLGAGYHAQLDVGRYLAGDLGGTFTLTREFETGWRIGAFATLTNVSARDFGEGSFDKGIIIQAPLAWLTGQPTRIQRGMVLRPLTRDGGARLGVDGRLYQTLSDYGQSGLQSQWGRFWK